VPPREPLSPPSRPPLRNPLRPLLQRTPASPASAGGEGHRPRTLEVLSSRGGGGVECHCRRPCTRRASRLSSEGEALPSPRESTRVVRARPRRAPARTRTIIGLIGLWHGHLSTPDKPGPSTPYQPARRGSLRNDPPPLRDRPRPGPARLLAFPPMLTTPPPLRIARPPCVLRQPLPLFLASRQCVLC